MDPDSRKPASLSSIVDRLFKKDQRVESEEDEIRSAVDESVELDADEKRMIHDVLDLGDTTAEEVMTPRVDIIAVEDTETVRQAIDRMRGTGYSRLPVYHDDHDSIIGVVRYKDLIDPLLDDRESDCVKDYVAEAMFVPESKSLLSLLNEMQTNRQQMAIVVDEYGGTAGLITTEDIVEEIVGEIVDETDPVDADITQVSDSEWVVNGACPCETLEEMGWPVKAGDDYETVGGWLMDTFDCVPQLGDEFSADGYSFKVQRMRRRRVSSLRVRKVDAASQEEAEADR